MNATKTTTTAETRPNQQLGEATVVTQPGPTLDSVVRAICMDAKYDSLKYVLRSDTGHDGE